MTITILGGRSHNSNIHDFSLNQLPGVYIKKMQSLTSFIHFQIPKTTLQTVQIAIPVPYL